MKKISVLIIGEIFVSFLAYKIYTELDVAQASLRVHNAGRNIGQ
ncbi:MAG: hypothetical protein ABR542_01650 [Desulfonatronovibrio sp.]